MDKDKQDLIVEPSEGNPGAIRVLTELLQEPDGFLDILELKRQEVTGSLIWIRYKDVCSQDIEALRENIKLTAAEHRLPQDRRRPSGLSDLDL